ncbi:JAB domain-containing protein [Staphylococcus simulans]
MLKLYYKINFATEPEELYQLVNEKLDLANCNREHLVMAGFNSQMEVMCLYVVSIGTLDASIAHPREAFSIAILNNCSIVAFAHNHPGGSLKPSDKDIECAKRFEVAGAILGIPMIDSIIVSRKGYYSLRENGHLSE